MVVKWGVKVVRVWESAKESGRMDGVVGLQVVVNSRADLMGKAKTVVRQAKPQGATRKKREERRSGQSLGRSGGLIAPVGRLVALEQGAQWPGLGWAE